MCVLRQGAASTEQEVTSREEEQGEANEKKKSSQGRERQPATRARCLPNVAVHSHRDTRRTHSHTNTLTLVGTETH